MVEHCDWLMILDTELWLVSCTWCGGHGQCCTDWSQDRMQELTSHNDELWLVNINSDWFWMVFISFDWWWLVTCETLWYRAHPNTIYSQHVKHLQLCHTLVVRTWWRELIKLCRQMLKRLLNVTSRHGQHSLMDTLTYTNLQKNISDDKIISRF